MSGDIGTKDGYTGYGAEQGTGPLRKKIAEKLYGGRIDADEVRRRRRRRGGVVVIVVVVVVVVVAARPNSSYTSLNTFVPIFAFPCYYYYYYHHRYYLLPQLLLGICI